MHLGFDNAADQQGAVPHCTLRLAGTAHTLSVWAKSNFPVPKHEIRLVLPSLTSISQADVRILT